MVDTVRIRIHGLNDKRNTLGDEISVSNGFEKHLFVCPSHNELYRKMLQYKGKHFSSVLHSVKEKSVINELSDSEYIELEFGKKVSAHYQIRDVMTFSDEKKQKSIYKSFTGKYSVPSSHHGVTFTVNDNAGFIDFQMSVPKYLFGHSLGQFVPQIHSRLYEKNYSSAQSWKFQQMNLHKRLMDFLDMFLDDLQTMFSIDKPFDKDYIELVRIDLCFNQYFESKDKALRALGELKKMNNRRKGKASANTEEYETSLTYQSADGSYFKIYHKGTEYQESKFGDLKKHMQINMAYLDHLNRSVDYGSIYGKNQKKIDEIDILRGKAINTNDPKIKKAIYKKYRKAIKMIFENRGKGVKSNLDPKMKELIKSTVYDINKKLPFKVDFFKKEMDKVLRYEVSIKGAYLTYLYKTKVFRANCPIHNGAIETFKKVHSIYYSLDAKKVDLKVRKSEKDTYDMINAYQQRKVSLTLSSSDYLKRFEKNGIVDFDERNMCYNISKYDLRYTGLGFGDIGTFSPRLLDFCVKHFYKLVKYYQVEKLTEYDSLTALVHAHNEKVKKNVLDYNRENEYLTVDHLGRKRVKGNKIITKASQLLTRNELNDKGFKTVNTLVILTILRFMRSGKSLDQVFKEMKLSKYQEYRYRKDLQLFNINAKSSFLDENLNTCTDFKAYYEKCETTEYLTKMFITSKMRSYE